jgi:hypothetical protein
MRNETRMSSGVRSRNIKRLLKSGSGKRCRHQTIGCEKYDLEIELARSAEFCAYAGEALLEAYVDPQYLASVLQREGFSGGQKLLEERFPPTDAPFGVRIGDFGEVVGHMVLEDFFGFTIPVMKLRFKTNWDRAAFGIDIIAFRLDDQDPHKDTVAFAEVKTSKQRDTGVVEVFREIASLAAEGQSEARNKMRNAVRFVSERLFEQGQHELEQRIYRFLDCYTNPHHVEGFFPFLVRDASTWADEALDSVEQKTVAAPRVVLCVVMIGDLEETVQAAYDAAARVTENGEAEAPTGHTGIP